MTPLTTPPALIRFTSCHREAEHYPQPDKRLSRRYPDAVWYKYTTVPDMLNDTLGSLVMLTMKQINHLYNNGLLTIREPEAVAEPVIPAVKVDRVEQTTLF